jgi:capsular polysaccharide biosynthesis protein
VGSGPEATLGNNGSAHALRGLASRAASDKRTAAIWAVGTAALLLLAVALVAVWMRPTEYRAEARVLIVPTQTRGDAPVVSLDTLSRGTVVETFAQVLASERIRSRAFRRAGLSAAAHADTTIETSVLSGTAIVRILATAGGESQAEAAANAVADHRPYLAGYTAAFRPLTLASGRGSAEPAGPSPLVLSAALVVAALVNAFLVVFLLRRRSADADQGTPLAEAQPLAEAEPLEAEIILPAETETGRPQISVRR